MRYKQTADGKQCHRGVTDKHIRLLPGKVGVRIPPVACVS